MEIVGREEEKAILGQCLADSAPTLLLVHGRRRVGKTHLIRNFCGTRGVYFEVTGRRGIPLQGQLQGFKERLQEVYLDGAEIGSLRSWHEALRLLTAQLKRVTDKKQIVFIDELPWMATRRSRLLSEIDYFWNTEWSRIPHLMVVLCGSAASWMISKVLNNKGGLHNRITEIIRLQPFSLREAQAYLVHRGVQLTSMQLAELYMAVGGVPLYLNFIKRGNSATQAVESSFFAEGAPLADEFERIFPALFDNPGLHRAIVETLARKRKGLFRKDLLGALGGSSGSLANALRELGASGFIQKFIPYGLSSRSPFFRVVDELSLFYLKWVQGARKRGAVLQPDHWLLRSQSAAWHSWAGYSFENLCYKHAAKIIAALGVSGVRCNISAWKFRGDVESGLSGADVDLLVDRADGIINLCEIKFTREPLVVDKRFIRTMQKRVTTFRAVMSPKKMIVPVLISAQGVVPGKYASEIARQTYTLEDLLRP